MIQPIKNSPFTIKFKNFPFCFLVFFYFCSLLIAAIVTPLIFNFVVVWAQWHPCELTQYLLRKGFVIFFERMRLIALLLFIPHLWKMYRQHSPKKLATDCDGKIFGQFFILGCFLIPMIFGIKMLILDFSLTISPRLYFFLGKSLLGAMALSFLEEWLFRGLIFKILLNPVKPFLATIFSSLLFAYFHFRPHYEPNPSSRFATLGDGFHCLYEVTFRSLVGISWFKFSIIFSLGCLLATVYFRTRNLLASVGLHGAIVFTLMIFREWIYFPATNFFFGSNDLFNSPLALLVILFFTISFSAYYTHFYSQKS